jgi:hypothetical protein
MTPIILIAIALMSLVQGKDIAVNAFIITGKEGSSLPVTLQMKKSVLMTGQYVILLNRKNDKTLLHSYF